MSEPTPHNAEIARIKRALTERAQSYFRDAQRFAEMPPGDLAASGMDHEQWASVYRSVADELHKVVAEAHLVEVGPRLWCEEHMEPHCPRHRNPPASQREDGPR